ncbi:MAG: nucleotidyl transferase AbiEii/AbiGii toxin family protein [Sphaerochaeta sp.]
MNSEIQAMLSFHQVNDPSKSVNAIKEVIQEVVLYALSKTDFFSHAAFYGGTALRIFYGLNRFSEDMDFSLQTKTSDFSLTRYLPEIEAGLHSYGFEMEANQKIKQVQSNIQSAFLKGNTLTHFMKIFALTPPISGIHSNATIKIKFEIDIDPPGGAFFEKKYKLLPQPYSVMLYDKPSLFAGKLHALLCRSWKSREKGRDFYDYVWYLKERVPVNLTHLEARMRQSGHWQSPSPLSLSDLKNLLRHRFESLDLLAIKADVEQFITNPESLDIWSKEFFVAITEEIRSQE